MNEERELRCMYCQRRTAAKREIKGSNPCGGGKNDARGERMGLEGEKRAVVTVKKLGEN